MKRRTLSKAEREGLKRLVHAERKRVNMREDRILRQAREHGEDVLVRYLELGR